jgi:hypothetical protein
MILININRFSSITLAISIVLVNVGCDVQNQTNISSDLSEKTHESAITFTKFFIEKENDAQKDNSDYIFYIYNHKTKTYKYKCFNSISGCQNSVTAKQGDTVSLNMKLSQFTANDNVYLRIWEDDWKKQNVLNQVADSNEISLASCPHDYYNRKCLKIPVQYLYNNKKNDCLKIETKLGNDKICLFYKFDAGLDL